MTYIGNPNWKFDIFFSYARLNDRAGLLTPAWVTTFRDELLRELGDWLGEPIEDLFDVETKETPTDKSFERWASQSAIFVPIFTPSFFNSNWCPGEIAAFKRVHGGIDNVVAVQPIPLTDFSKLDGIIPVQFFDSRERDPERFEWSSPEAKKALSTFRKRLIKKLNDLRTEARAVRAPDADLVDPSAFKVFIAYNEDEDELKRRGKKIAANLEKMEISPGVAVIGQGSFDEIMPDKRQQALEAALNKCDLFVQLIGAEPGAAPEWAEDGMVRHIGERALATKDEVQILRCRAADFSINDIEQKNAKFARYLKEKAGPLMTQEEIPFENSVEAHIRRVLTERKRIAEGRLLSDGNAATDRFGLGVVVRDKNAPFVKKIRSNLVDKPGLRPISYNVDDINGRTGIPDSRLNEICKGSASILIIRDMDEDADKWAHRQLADYYKYFDGNGIKAFPPTVFCHAHPAENDCEIEDFKEISTEDLRSIDPEDEAAIKKASERLADKLRNKSQQGVRS
jgi:hypothetical protein